MYLQKMKLPQCSIIYSYFMGAITALIISLLSTNIISITMLWKRANVLKITNCTSKPLIRAIQRRDHFWVFYNFVQAEMEFSCDESLTYATPATYTFFDNLPPLVEVWKGPISIALYAPGDDFYTTLKSIAYLRNCESPLIKQFVTFHLFFEENHFPSIECDEPLIKAYNDTYDCGNGAPYENIYQTSYRAEHELTFPINVARNIARETAQTHFIFSSDIQLFPTPNFIEKFLNMVVNRKALFIDRKSRVFVLPIFEVVQNQTIPTTKSELQQMIKEETAVLFHVNICALCHQVINGNKWLNSIETEGLNIFAVGKRCNEYRFWEPIYVGTNNDPFFDERMTWEGRSDKMSQAFTLCLLDYDFMILNNAFLTHTPGIKTDHNIKYKELVLKAKLLLRGVQDKLNNIYGYNQECAI